MKTIIVKILAAFICSCASMSTTMHNKETGQNYKCQASGWGWFGTPAAIIMHHRCVKDMESRGYIQQ